METTLNQRIKIFAAYKDYGQKEMAESMGVSVQTMNSIMNGNSNPRITTLNRLINSHPELNKTWLLSGEGEMIATKKSTSKSDNNRFASAVDVEMLANEVQMLKQMILKLMGKMENFHTSPLQVGKILSINEGTFAGDYGLAQVG